MAQSGTAITFVPVQSTVWVWNPYASVGLLAFVIGLSFAGFVYFVRPDRVQNRRLALVLVFESLAWGSGAGFLFSTTDIRLAWGFQALFQISLLVLPWVYLRFIATLRSPLVAWLRPRPVDALLVAGAFLSPLLYFQERSRFISGFTTTWYAPLDAVLGPWFMFPVMAIGAVTLFALVVAVHVVLREPPGVELQRARAYLYAFGVRDGIIFTILIIVPLAAPLPPSGQWTDAIYVLGTPISTLLFVPIAAYGILKAQLFAIDLRVKWTLRRSTLLTGLTAVFFVAKEGIEALLPIEGVVPSIAGAAVVGIIALPAWRLAGRVTDRLMPDVEDSATYRDERKAAIYRAQVGEASIDGDLSVRDRRLLSRLQANLGLDAQVARRLERDVSRATAGDAT